MSCSCYACNVIVLKIMCKTGLSVLHNVIHCKQTSVLSSSNRSGENLFKDSLGQADLQRNTEKATGQAVDLKRLMCGNG